MNRFVRRAGCCAEIRAADRYRTIIATMTAVAATALMYFPSMAFADWEDHERLTREALLARLSRAPDSGRINLKAKNLSDLDLHGIDFRGADLSSGVFNGANLRDANFDNANLTVAFFEHADLTNASLRNAILFSVQLAGGILRGANLSGARFIGDLKNTDFTDATMTHMKGAADMKNQSMGLMRTSMVNATAVNADLSYSDFSRGEFTFSNFSHSKMINTRLYRADFSGSDLTGADLTGAQLQEAQLINVDLTGANLTDADLTGANMQGVRGFDSATTTGTRGLRSPQAAGDEGHLKGTTDYFQARVRSSSNAATIN